MCNNPNCIISHPHTKKQDKNSGGIHYVKKEKEFIRIDESNDKKDVFCTTNKQIPYCPREGRDRIITCPSRLPMMCGISIVGATTVTHTDFVPACETSTAEKLQNSSLFIQQDPECLKMQCSFGVPGFLTGEFHIQPSLVLHVGAVGQTYSIRICTF